MSHFHENNLLKAWNTIQPPFFYVRILQVANSGSTCGWQLLEGVKNLRDDLWKQICAFSLDNLFFWSLSSCFDKMISICILAEIISPTQLPTQPTVLAFFSPRCTQTCNLSHHHFILLLKVGKINLNLPLFLHKFRLNS